MLEEPASKQIISLPVVILTTPGDDQNLDNNNSLEVNSYYFWVCQPGQIISNSAESRVALICDKPSIRFQEEVTTLAEAGNRPQPSNVRNCISFREQI